MLYKFLNNYYKNKPNIIKEQHINNILSIINNQNPNLEINLPKNQIARKSYNNLYLEKKEINNNNQKNYKILLKDNNIINNIIIKKIKESENDGNDICRINSQNIKLPLYIRNRQPGDFIETKGLNGKKKIKEIFIEKKIDKNLRENYPIVVDDNNQIIWLPNLKKSKFNAKKDEFYDIILKYCEKEENDE